MNRSPRPATRILVVVALTFVVALATASPALAVMSRSLVMYRAEKWVSLKIPYSQSVYRTLEGQAVGMSSGWRTDCSGFTSMAWNTYKPGYSTRTLYQTSTRISKEQLRPGDALVAANYHAVIFGGWANAEHTKFWEYQMGSEVTPGDGTGVRVEDYPGPSPATSPYIPYRLNGISAYINYPRYIEAIQGASRYSTAIASSQSAFASGAVETVIIASGQNWPDALRASALAGAVDGPVLLTPPSALLSDVRNEITRLGAHEVIVVGGTSAVNDNVFGALEALKNLRVHRIAGDDRYSTAAAIAEEAVVRLKASGNYDGNVFITTGENFPDALAASPLAAKSGWPILLTRGDILSPAARSAVTTIGASSAVVLGSTTAVGTSVETALVTVLSRARVSRIGGANRYDTAFKIATYGMAKSGLGVASVAIATGTNFPDALAGGVMAGKDNTVLLLTPPDWLDADVKNLLTTQRSEIGKPRVLGSPLAVTPMAREAIAVALGAKPE